MSDPSLTEFSRAEPAFLSPGVHWIDHPTSLEQVQVSMDGLSGWEDPDELATNRMRPHRGGIYIRPANNVTMRARFAGDGR